MSRPQRYSEPSVRIHGLSARKMDFIICSALCRSPARKKIHEKSIRANVNTPWKSRCPRESLCSPSLSVIFFRIGRVISPKIS